MCDIFDFAWLANSQKKWSILHKKWICIIQINKYLVLAGVWVVFKVSPTCTELRRQYPFRGKRMTWVESWFQPALTELHMTSPISGKMSSMRALSPLSVILSPSSGATRTTTHSHMRDVYLESCSERQRSRSARRGCSWKYRASSYSRENSCTHTHTQRDDLIRKEWFTKKFKFSLVLLKYFYFVFGQFMITMNCCMQEMYIDSSALILFQEKK